MNEPYDWEKAEHELRLGHIYHTPAQAPDRQTSAADGCVGATAMLLSCGALVWFCFRPPTHVWQILGFAFVNWVAGIMAGRASRV